MTVEVLKPYGVDADLCLPWPLRNWLRVPAKMVRPRYRSTMVIETWWFGPVTIKRVDGKVK